jgi:hypothetical protein
MMIYTGRAGERVHWDISDIDASVVTLKFAIAYDASRQVRQ